MAADKNPDSPGDVNAGRDAYKAHRDIHVYPPGDRNLGPLARRAPDEGADRVMGLSRQDALDELTEVTAEVSAAVLEVLWHREEQDLLVSLLTGISPDMAREIARLLTGIIGADSEWLRLVPDAVLAVRRCADKAKRKLGGVERQFYHPLSSQVGTHGFCQRHEKGRVYWTSAGGAQVVSGKIADCHDALGGSEGGLGFPLTAEADAPLGGRQQRFEGNMRYGKAACDQVGLEFGGTVYWIGQPESAAHAAWGNIGERYELSGGPSGDLGYPLTNEEGVVHGKTGTPGARQRFEGGSVYCNYNGGTFTVPPQVSAYHDAHGGNQEWMGFPASDYLPAEPSRGWGTTGSYQRFQWDQPYEEEILKGANTFGGTVYVSDAHGVYAVSKAIGTYHEREGGTSGWLGFPRSDEIDGRTSPDQPWRCYQYFEGGMVFWSDEHRAVAVPGPVMQLFEQNPVLAEVIGFPVEAAKPFAGGNGHPKDGPDQLQFFERGMVAIRDGSPDIYLRTGFPPVAPSRPVSLDALSLSSESVTHGQAIALEYVIQTSFGSAFPVVLGASLVSESGEEYFDKAGDRKVHISPGQVRYRRLLRVPASVPDGRYRLIGAVWYPAVGGQRLAKLDRGFVVNVIGCQVVPTAAPSIGQPAGAGRRETRPADGRLFHTIRNADGTWLSPFKPVDRRVAGGPSEFTVVSCAEVRAEMQVVAVGTDGQLWQTVRGAGGTWQDAFVLVGGRVAGGPAEGFSAVACGGTGETLQVVGLGTDSRLYHTLRGADGAWQPSFWLVGGAVSGGPGGFTAVSCAGVGAELHLACLGDDGNLYYTIRYPDGTWQNPFKILNRPGDGSPTSFSQISCAGAGTELHLLGASPGGQLWHTIRDADGSRQRTWSQVAAAVAGGPAQFTGIACAGAGTTMHLLGTGDDGRLYHTLRRDDGAWQLTFGMVETRVSGGPYQFAFAACAGLGDVLQLLGGT